MILGGYNVRTLLARTGREILDDRVPSLAAQTAYYFFFSLFPLLLFLTPILSFFADKELLIGWVQARLSSTVGAESMAPIRAAMEEVVYSTDAPGVMSIGALLAAWSGSNIFGALMDSLNIAYDVKERRPFWKRILVRLAMLLVAGGTLVLATVVMLAGGPVASWIGGTIGASGEAIRTWTLLQYPVAFVFLVGIAFLVLYILPNVKQRWTRVLVAALVTTVLWIAVTLLFRLYVTNFGSYNKTYGTIGGIIVLLMWMYLSMLVFLAGGELASEMHRGTGEVSVRGGVVYHGRLVTAELPDSDSFSRAQRRREVRVSEPG
jgi:membrane protein